MDNYHATSKEGVHKLTREGAARASVVFEGTQREAHRQFAEYMQTHPGSMKIHNEHNGRVREERTYPGSADPRRSKG